MVKETINYTYSAQIEELVDYLAKNEYHKNPLHIDVDGELKTIFDQDRENFPLLVRSSLQQIIEEKLHNEFNDPDLIDDVEIRQKAEDIVNDYHIILETKNIRKIQEITLKTETQTCDVIVLGKGPREAYVKKACFVCDYGCKRFDSVKYDKLIPKPEPENCDKHGRPWSYSEIKSEYDFIQRIVIQEQLSDAKNSSPIDYEARIIGQMVNEVFVGQKKRIMLTPRLAVKKSKESQETKLFFDVVSIADLEEEKKIMPTNQEIEEYRKMSSEPGYFDKWIESFAPNVIGDELKPVKKALLLALIGSNKIQDSRAEINVLLLGDPSVAKSSLLKYCQNVVQKGIYTSGKGTSAAGLTIGMVKRSDGTMMPQAGILPLCHNGVALIDEFDKMDDQDRGGMHEAMEQQSVSIAKAGTSLTLPAQATVIAAANPKYGKWDVNMPILDNANLPPALMSRFDIKFRILDTFNELLDSKKATHVVAKFRKEKETIFSRLQVLSLINYAKTLKPQISDDAAIELQKLYVRLRKKNITDIAIDLRQLESLIRMSIAHAKLHFKDFVDMTDVHSVYEIYKASLSSFGIDIESEGEQTHFMGDRRELNKHETFWECFAKCMDENQSVSKEDMIAMMSDTKYFTQASAKVFFDSLCRGSNQQLLEGANGRFRRIS